ncbi:hypothetical protein ACFW9F_23800 [Streptomyces sp. NPDC059506]|uniref:hypothetical protein n=1 Tax=Streptomyces TaxID=1883 RepID=UPI000CC4DB70|nr:hypothetical protein [Streptomyces sp. SCUT-3]PLW71268.1 hypothetical protein C0036_18745 [Streptomyces sp. DJ]QMV22050.1 hypothetical protein GQS52_09945 [Streptomyces sp. SCUT-3]
MYSPPDDDTDARRLRTAHATAATALGVTCAGPLVWGWRGRTLGRRATHPEHGTCWLRLLRLPADKAHGRLWDGTAAAAASFPTVHRPALHAVHDLPVDDAGRVCRAELSAFITAPVLSPGPVLRTPLDLPDTWWKALRADLDTVAATPTDRTAVRRQWIDRAVPRYTGAPAPHIGEWTTAHGDLHWANLTGPDLCLLDWEGHGTAPAGYDAALLHAYTLLQPDTAHRARAVFADILDTPTGRAAQLVVAADLLQAASRGDHPELVPALHARVAALTGESNTSAT